MFCSVQSMEETVWEKRARLEGKIDNKETIVDSSKSGNGCDPVHRCRD